MEIVAKKEEEADNQAKAIKAAKDHEDKLKKEYDDRFNAANVYDGTIHLENGQR
jgi:hypothetical protein